MANRQQIPEELLEVILWQLKMSTGFRPTTLDTNSVSRKTLASCMLASRTLSRVAKPVLYHTININVEEDRIDAAQSYYALARRLAQNPGLADQVRELCVSNHACHLFARIMEDGESSQWSEYLRSRLAAHRSLHSGPRGCGGYNMTLPTLFLLICTKICHLSLETVTCADVVLKSAFLSECIALGRVQPKVPSFPLMNLQTLILDYPIKPDIHWNRSGPEDEWMDYLLGLPQIVSISLNTIAYASRYARSTSSSLRSLTATNTRDLSVDRLKELVRACPMLDCLEITWARHTHENMTFDWAEFGALLTTHSSRMQKVKADRSRIYQPPETQSGLINLATLQHLQSLTLPIEALLRESAGEYIVPDDAAEEEPDDVGFDQEEDIALDDEDEFAALHRPGEGLNTPTTPLYQLLPPTLKNLTIIDDWHLWADAVRLDRELRSLVVSSRCPELRKIRVTRQMPFTKHVRDLGWQVERREGVKDWNVLLRL